MRAAATRASHQASWRGDRLRPGQGPPAAVDETGAGCASSATAPVRIEVLSSQTVPPVQILMWMPRRCRGHMRPSQNSTWASANASEPP